MERKIWPKMTMGRYVILGLFILCGCYKVPDPLLEEIPQELSLQNSLELALKSKELQEGPWPDSHWWEWFNDPQLTALIVEGLENSPDLKKAEARLKASLEIATKIRGKLFPHIKFFYQENYEHLSAHGLERQFIKVNNPPPSALPPALQGVNFSSLITPVPAILNVMDLGFSMDWDLDIFGKNRYQWKAAIGEARATEAETKQTELILSSQITQAYFSYQTHQAILEVYKKIIDERKLLEHLVKKRESVGLDTQFETDAAKINLLNMEKLVYDLEESVALDQHRLFALIGMNPDSDRKLEFHFTPLSSTLSIPKEISSNLLARRPDLMAEIWQVERAAADIGVAKAQFYPEINLQGLLSLRSVFPDDLFSLSSMANSLLPSFNLPIFKGGELRANLHEKLARFEESVHSYHQSLLGALQNVADVLTQIESTGKQLESQKSVLENTDHRKNMKEIQYKIGPANYLSYLEFNIESLNQHIALINLQSDQMLLAVKLMQALGGGYNSSLEVPEKFVKGTCDAQ